MVGLQASRVPLIVLKWNKLQLMVQAACTIYGFFFFFSSVRVSREFFAPFVDVLAEDEL